MSAEVAAADGRGEVRLREAADGWNEEAGWDEAEATAVLDLAEASLRATAKPPLMVSDCLLIASLIRRAYERPPSLLSWSLIAC